MCKNVYVSFRTLFHGTGVLYWVSLKICPPLFQSSSLGEPQNVYDTWFQTHTPLLSLCTTVLVPQLQCQPQILIREFYFFPKTGRDIEFDFNILCTHSIVSMFIQVGVVGGTEYDLLVDPVGGQVTKLIYSIMTRLIWVEAQTHFYQCSWCRTGCQVRIKVFEPSMHHQHERSSTVWGQYWYHTHSVEQTNTRNKDPSFWLL